MFITEIAQIGNAGRWKLIINYTIIIIIIAYSAQINIRIWSNARYI